MTLGRGFSDSYRFSLIGESSDGGKPVEITFTDEHLHSIIRENRNKSIGVRLGFVRDKVINKISDTWGEYCRKEGFDLPKEKRIFHLIGKSGLFRWFRADFDDEEIVSLIKSSSRHKQTILLHRGLLFLRDSVMGKTDETWDEYSKRVADEISAMEGNNHVVSVENFSNDMVKGDLYNG